MRYSLNIPNNNQNISFFPLENSESIISLCCNVWWSSHTISLAFLFLSLLFSIVTGDELVSGFSDKYRVHSLFIVFRPSTKIQLSIQDLPIVIGNSMRNTCLDTMKHDCTSVAWQWTNRKHLLFARGNVCNSKVAFYNKTACFLRHRCLYKDHLVVNPV